MHRDKAHRPAGILPRLSLALRAATPRTTAIALLAAALAPAALADAGSRATSSLSTPIALALFDDPSTSTDAAPAALSESSPGAPVSAADATAHSPEKPLPSWTVRLQPVAWFASPSGTLKLPVNSGNGPAGFAGESDDVDLDDLDLDRARLRPAGQVIIAAGDWMFSFSGASYDIGLEDVSAPRDFRLGAVALSAGQSFNIDFEMGLYELTAGYRILRHDFAAASKRPADAIPLIIDVHAFAGARFYDLSIDFRRTSAGAGASTAAFDELIVEPLIGLRLDAAFDEHFGIGVLAAVGYLPGDNPGVVSFDISAGFTWRPLPYVGATIGYRQHAYDLQKGDGASTFEYDGRLAGLFAGLEITF